MMDFGMMRGTGGSGMMFFAWTTYLIVNITLIYGILCMNKYLRRK